jgi:cytochrome c oxidase assembly factor CtaG
MREPIENELATSARFAKSELQDQQLGGVIMWAPANPVFIAMGLWRN